MIAFSPGIAQGCFDLLGIASRNTRLTFPEIRSAFACFGGMPSKIVIETAQALKWLRASEEGLVTLTASGSHLLALTGYEGMLRQAILDYIEIERPPWLQNAAFGRARVLSFAGGEIAQVLVEAGLAHGIENEVVAFWDALAARARGQKNERLAMIGRQGEGLSIAYEVERTGRTPKWIAIENNADGYDVLSIVAADDPRSLSIEVKASTQGLSGSFFLTRNEWDRAQGAENHAFHFWDIRQSAAPSLAIVGPIELETHVPCDKGSGEWQSVAIALSTFRQRFIQTDFQGQK